MYCVKCGVRLADGAARCPLCQTPVRDPDEALPAPPTFSDRYPDAPQSRRYPIMAFLTALLAAVSLSAPALSMPWFFKLGAEKGRIAYYAAFGLFFGAAAVLSRSMTQTGLTALSGSLHLALGVLCLLYAGSWALSTVLYKTREF